MEARIFLGLYGNYVGTYRGMQQKMTTTISCKAWGLGYRLRLRVYLLAVCVAGNEGLNECTENGVQLGFTGLWAS